MNSFTRIAGALALAAGSTGAALAQTATTIPPTFFGINYTYYVPPADSYKDFIVDLSNARLGMVRVGGNEANSAAKGTQYFVDAATNIRSTGAEPLIQIPKDLPPGDVAGWIDTFNVTNKLNIRYFAIGNEPDPGGTSTGAEQWQAWYANTTSTNVEVSYKAFKDNFVAMAKAIRNKKPDAIIVGPDFRLFYGDATNAGTPFGSYYVNFLDTVGRESYTPPGQTVSRPLLDIFAIHFYAYGVKNEADTAARFAQLQALLKRTNDNRAGPDLTSALGEVNQMPTQFPYTWDFEAGHFMATMFKHTLLSKGQFVAPWSVREDPTSERRTIIDSNKNTNFGVYDYVPGNLQAVSRRSTMWHLGMLSEHRQSNYMNFAYRNGNDADLTVFAMKGAQGFTVMVMNTSDTRNITYSATMNAGTYLGTTGVQLAFDGAKTGADTSWTSTIDRKSTVVYTFNAAGQRLYKYMLKKYDANGVVVAYPKQEVTKLKEVFGTTTNYQLSNVLAPANYAQPEGDNRPNVQLVAKTYGAKPTGAFTQWRMVPSTKAGMTGWYHLKNMATAQLVRPLNSSNTVGEAMQQVADDAGARDLDSTHWRPEQAIDGSYWLRNGKSGLYLRPAAGSTATNAVLVQDLLNHSFSSFRWNIAP